MSLSLAPPLFRGRVDALMAVVGIPVPGWVYAANGKTTTEIPIDIQVIGLALTVDNLDSRLQSRA